MKSINKKKILMENTFKTTVFLGLIMPKYSKKPGLFMFKKHYSPDSY